MMLNIIAIAIIEIVIPVKFGVKFSAGISFSVVNQACMIPGMCTSLLVV